MAERIAAVLVAGVTSSARLTARGIPRRDIERAVGTGDLVRVRRNALIDGDRWRSAPPWERHELRARAVAAGFARGGTQVLTHHSALAVQGISLHGVDDRVHIARTDGGRGRSDRLVSSHRRIEARFVEHHHGVAVAVPAVACLQVAAQFGAEAGLVSADDALHRGVFDLPALANAVTELGFGRWARAPAELLQLVDERVESAAESRTRWAFHVLGFRQPTPQVVIRDENAKFVARVDFLYEDLKLVIEVDGLDKYRSTEDLVAEKLREDRLRELGYTIVRLTWADLGDLAAVNRKVMQGVDRAAA